MSGLTTLRLAGFIESYHIARCKIGFDSVVIVAAQYFSKPSDARVSQSGVLTKHILYPALEQVIHNHASLASSISSSSSDSEPSFVLLPSIDLASIVRFVSLEASDDSSLEKLLEQQFATPITSSAGSPSHSPSPLWRLIVTSDNFVIFAWHHGIGDGLSGRAFHNSLLHALNNVTTPSPSPSADAPYIVTIPPSLKLTPALDSLTSLAVSWPTFFRILLSLLPPLPFRSTTHIWTGNAIPTAPSLVNHARAFGIPPTDAHRLLKLCKEHQTTVTALLHELAVIVLLKLLQERKDNGQASCITSIPTAIPISLRRLTHTPFSEMVDQTSAYQHTATYSPSELTIALRDRDSFPWSRAANLSQKLRDLSTASDSRSIIGSLKYLFGRYEAFLISKLGKNREFGIEVSNLGAFRSDEPTQGQNSASEPTWSIVKMFFAQNDGVQGAAIKINVAGDPLAGINVTVTSGKGALPDELLDKFSEELSASFLRICSAT